MTEPAIPLRVGSDLEPLPASAKCGNCAELRRLLAGMRSRVDELEREYVLLMQRFEQASSPSSAIEIVSDLPAPVHLVQP